MMKPSAVRRNRSSHPEVFLRKGGLKVCSKFKGERACQSAISIKLLCNSIEIALRHGHSPVNLLHIFRTPFLDNTSGRLLLKKQILLSFKKEGRWELNESGKRFHLIRKIMSQKP